MKLTGAVPGALALREIYVDRIAVPPSQSVRATLTLPLVEEKRMPDYNFAPETEAFLAEKNFLVLATSRRDGSPQVTPVWYLWEDGRFLINVLNGRAKVKNFGRDPRVAFVIQDLANPYRYLQVRGRISDSAGGDTGHDDIDRLSARYTGAATYRADPTRETDRITFYIEPEWHQTMGL